MPSDPILIFENRKNLDQPVAMVTGYNSIPAATN